MLRRLLCSNSTARRTLSTVDTLEPPLLVAPESRARLGALQRFIRSELLPLEAEAAAAAALTDGNRTPPQLLRELRRKVARRSAALGFFGMTQPASFGGAPASQIEILLCREALAAANLPKLGTAVFGPGAGLLGTATGKLRERYLQPLLSGEIHGSFGFTEPADATERTKAVRDGDELVVTGVKSYVTGGDTADFVAALCSLREADGAKAGTALVVVPLDSPGVTVERVFRSMDPDTPGHAYVVFREARVPAWSVVGKSGGRGGMESAMRQIGSVRLMLSAEAVGTTAWALTHARERLGRPHRSGTPLAERDHVKLRLGELHAQAFAARCVLYRTAQLLESGEPAKAELIACKLVCTETAGRVVDGCVQLCGGTAVVVGDPLEAAYKRARQWRFAEGESDVLRMKLGEQALAGEARL